MAVEGALRRPRGARMAVERAGKRVLVTAEVAGEDRFRCEACGGERLVDPVAREGVDEPGRISDEEDVSRRGRRGADAPHREPVAAEVGEGGRGDAVRVREHREVVAEIGAL